MMCFRRPAKRHTKSKHGKPSKGTVEAVQVANPPASPMKDEGVVVEYITTRLIALTCAAESSDEKFAESLQTAASALRSSHGAHFKVWSVSRRRRDVTTSLEAVQVGWPPDVAPPLERICTVCKSIDQWLLEHPLNVAVLFCKGAFYRAAIIVDAFMRYNAISATDDAIDDRFNMKRFADRNLILDGPPSYKRYMNYFTSLLSGRILVNPAPLHLRLVTLKHFQPGNVYLKVYERLLPVFQSKNVALKETTKIEVGDLRLRGDVFIKCVLVSTVAAKNESGKVLFTCQLNTCSLVVPPTTDGSPTLLRLHKEELDLIFNDKKVDNRALLELSVSHDSSEPSTSKPNSRPNSSSSARNSLVRPNSYEAFDTLEDEGTNLGNAEVEYSEIKKHKVDDKMSVPPPVPPKPTMNGDIVEMPERRGVLPAQVRALVNQNKALEGRATPSIEPDLVGKDRYDKASRCFSYVPAKSMKEAFEKPRRPSFSRAIERREESVERVSQDDVARASIPRSVESRVDSPATWDEQVENAKQAALLEELARGIPSRQNYQQMPSDYGSDDTQQAQVVDQAQRAVVTPTSTLQRRASRERGSRYGSYRTLNDDAYCSDMDDLCDPDYYMNFSHPATPSTTTAPAPPMRHAGARSVQLPRRKLQPVEAFTDPLDDVLESTKRLNSAHSVGDVRTATNGAAVQDAFRNRHCQSVSSAKAPNHEENDEADSWLSGKLKKVRSKRDIDPDLVRRRTQEKMLLEELKDQRNEDNFNEGKGVQNVDPLLEFRREEERLKNTRSPYDERSWRGRMRGKPPTPPPREASASPVCHSGPPPSQGRQRHNASVPPSHHYVDEDFDVNSILNYNPYARDDQQDRGRSLSRGARIQDAWYSSQQDLPAKFYSGQERVAAAIFRAETPHRDLYASGTINRAETPGRYFPENSAVLERSATPSFPVARTTPVPFHPLLYNGSSNNNTINTRAGSPRHFGNGSVQLSRRSSVNSVDTSEIIHHHPLFVKDTSKYWYKPTISREQAISMLRDKQPGTFVVRDSNSFPGAFGLALKVAQAPPGVHPGDGTELVRHFLIEPSPKGVKLKGCNNEPVFGSLSALVYQHSITALALPTKLVLPDFDPAATPEHVSATQALLEQGAACNVVYVGSVDVESLTGAECVKRSIATCSQRVYDQLSRAVSVHFKVSSQGVTLTDNTRKVFFRRHFSVQSVIFAGMDPIERRFENQHALGFHDGCLAQARMFGFVARLPSSADNVCHVFAELEPEQPASAVVNFINKVMLAQKSR